MAETSFDIINHRLRSGRLRCRDSCGASLASRLRSSRANIWGGGGGGICLNWGWHPDQGAAALGGIFHYMQRAKEFGLSAGKVDYDTGAIVKRSRAIAKAAQRRVGFLMKKNKISLIWGEAFIDAPGKVTVKPSKSDAEGRARSGFPIRASTIIIATGARPRVLPGIERTRNIGLDLISRPWCRPHAEVRC